MGDDALTQAAVSFAARWGPTRLRAVADELVAGASDEVLLGRAPGAEYVEDLAALLAAARSDTATGDRREVAALLRGAAAGYAGGSDTVKAEMVWSGPGTHSVPVRATAQVLTDVVAEAERELVLMTYSARPYSPLGDALTAAIRRGVQVTAVVETLQGARGALGGSREPAEAFAQVPGVQLWHWPVAQRTETDAKLHAKLAVADRRVLFVSSANLTQSGVGRNVEAGLVVRGGTVPTRAAEHIAELQARGVLARLQVGDR